MDAAHLIALCRGLGFTLRAENKNVHVVPAEKRTPELQAPLVEHKAELVASLTHSPVFGSLRVKLASLERQATKPQSGDDSVMIIITHHGDPEISQRQKIAAKIEARQRG